MVWGHTSPTIQNKCCWRASFLGGVPSLFVIYQICRVSLPDYRCTALRPNLDDDPSAVPRTHEHTDVLREVFLDDLRGLWDGYGAVGELIVSLPALKPS